VNLAFSVAIAAAASGNIALMVDGSRPDCLLVDGVADGLEREFLDPSTLSLFIASLKRFDIGSRTLCKYQLIGKIVTGSLTFIEIRR
jgi:hypothetical protein